jgi:hypothetical protein
MKAALGSQGRIVHRLESNMLSNPVMNRRLYTVAGSEYL